ncbi:MAG TPA: hypothetical protein EYG74_03480 [Sulfurimonas autotrophica]|nr:hypothetical protein [Sulfurimonas autotrophica]
MIKFILAVVAVILLGLVYYTYTSDSNNEPVKIVVKKDTSPVESKTTEKKVIQSPKVLNKVKVPKTSVTKEVVSELVDNDTDSLPMASELSLESSVQLDLEEESPERILEIEEEAGLTDVGGDNTPMETEKMVL